MGSVWDDKVLCLCYNFSLWGSIVKGDLKYVNFSFFVALPAEKRARTFGNGTREGRTWAIYLCYGSQRGTYNRTFSTLLLNLNEVYNSDSISVEVVCGGASE